MKPDQEKKIVIIGMGYLMEYIAPCYKKMMGDALAENVVAVTADGPDIPRKEKATGIHVVLNDNLGTLRAHRPDIIFFAPPPSVAPGLTEEVLAPYFAQVRAEGGPLPELYVFPPNPVGKFYQEKLGADISIANILPNMINEIAGRDTAAAGFTMVTLPDERGGWTEESLAFLERFWAPLGQVVFLTPAQVPVVLAVTCVNQMYSQIFADMAEVIRAEPVTAAALGEAARAYVLEKWSYEPPAPLESRLDAVSPRMLEAVKKVAFHGWWGCVDFMRNHGISEEMIQRIQNMNVDTNLRKVQLLERRELARAIRNHATRGGVLERACISYTQKWQDNVRAHFADYPQWTPDAPWAEALQDGFRDVCEDVLAHLSRLSSAAEKKDCTIEQHAILYALLVRHAVQEAGEERGRAVMGEATAVYGRERGARMRVRALANGDTPDALTYMAYGEWSAAPGVMVTEEQKDEELYYSHVHRCEWCRCWEKHGLLAYGKLYCEYVDVNIAHGYDPDFHLEVASLISAGADHCRFGYGFVLDDGKREQLRQLQEKLGDSARRDFNYHTAHLYYTCRRVLMEKLGDLGKDIADEALFSFTRRFGGGCTAAVTAYADTDFTQV